jgi:hypothetical protein
MEEKQMTSVGQARQAAHTLHLGMQSSFYCGHRWYSEAPCDIEMKPWIYENTESESGVKRVICIDTVHVSVFVRMLS